MREAMTYAAEAARGTDQRRFAFVAVAVFAILLAAMGLLFAFASEAWAAERFAEEATEQTVEKGDLVAGSIWDGSSEQASQASAASANGSAAYAPDSKAYDPRFDKRNAELVDDRPYMTAPYAIFPFIPNPTTEAFIESICEDARQIGLNDDLYASVMIAQAILESGSGSSGLSKPPYNNLFGIKGSYKGKSVALWTSEDDGSGAKYDIVSPFRRYPSPKESLQDYADLLKRDMGNFYAPTWKSNAKTYVHACNYLQGHYATDTSYSGKLQGIILAYDLTQYDHPKKEAPAKTKNERALQMLRAVSIDGRPIKSEAELVYADSDGAKQQDDARKDSQSADEGAGAQNELMREIDAVRNGEGLDDVPAPDVPPIEPAVPAAGVSIAVLIAMAVRGKLVALLM